MSNNALKCKITIIALALAAVISIVFISPILSSAQFHAETLQTIDIQKQQAIGLSVAVAGASTALSSLPDDMASPIADELADLSLPLFLIVCFLYLEKYLLTTFGWVSSFLLFPGACLLTIGYIMSGKDALLVWTKKLLILALALLMIIPTGAKVSSQIEATFAESINQTFHAASDLSNATETSENEGTNAFFSFISGLADNVSSLVDTAKNILNTFVDAIAVLLVTSCIIPILTFLVFFQVVKLIMDIDIPVKKLALLIYPTKRNRRVQKIEASSKTTE